MQIEGFNVERKDRAMLKKGTLNTKCGDGIIVYLADHMNISVEMTSNAKKSNQFGWKSTEKHKTYSYKFSSNVQWINDFSLQIDKAASLTC